MKVYLDDNDIVKIASLIATKSDSVICYDNEGIEVYFEYTITTRGYYEDDYNNGTGAYIAQYVSVDINDVYVPGSEVEVIYNEEKLIQLTKQQIAA